MMPRRTTTSSKTLLYAILGVCGAINVTILIWLLWYHPALNSDFLGFWSYPRFSATHPIAQIYDAKELQAFQQALYPGFHSFYPFTYPPDFLLVTWWLGAFSYTNARAIWTLAGLILLIPSIWYFFRARHPWLVVAGLLASPATLINLGLGQTAFFTTALLLFGFAALPRRPLLAGIAFGLLTLKPQLGALIPFFLLARGEWRAILTASAVALGLIALSCVAFPPGLWLLWAHMLPTYQVEYFVSHGLNLNNMITPAANLVVLGLPLPLVLKLQTLCSAAAVAFVFLAARRAPYRLAVAVLLAGSFLAVPHAYAYDSITLPAAMALCLTDKTPLWQVLLGCLVYLAPLLLLSPASHWFLYSLPETLLFAAIAAHALAATGSPHKTVVDAAP